MWRVGVLLAAAVLLELPAADVKTTEALLIHRLKRSPHHYENYEYYPLPSHHYHHPPPVPRFWPPFPPLAPSPPPRPVFNAFPKANFAPEAPCFTCGGSKGASSAISNAKSETGDAIAVAVAKGGPN